MKLRLTLAAAMAASMLLGSPARAESSFPPAIAVTGEGSVSVPPDLVRLNAGVASDGKTAREAMETNNAAMAKVLAALKAAGVEDKDFQTSLLSLQPQYTSSTMSRSISTDRSSIVGFHANNRVSIKLHDVGKVAGVLDALVAAGANDIGNINFAVSQPSKLLDEARERAIADARRKAEIYAKGAGVTLGAPLSIAENGAAPVFRDDGIVAGRMAASTPVAQGEETLSVTVNVSWAIKAAQ